ncbi:hypothetical protein BC940DRAFT_291780 [Gongronella butleri]|nr:hypothetical protein BC940DRAFT_291780 [Gongronella butleri]
MLPTPPQSMSPYLKPQQGPPYPHQQYLGGNGDRDSGFTETMSRGSDDDHPFHMSKSFIVHQADQTMAKLRHVAKIRNLEWKKVLKHKSGVTVRILPQEKTTLFKGDMVMHGFHPQAVFYIIGMRKLWDDAFDDGCLLENLNDTTSITYESYRGNGTSKAFDLTLVEKVDCSRDGEIVFAYTSVETAHMPKMASKARQQVLLQGWLLRSLPTTPPSTHVTFITEETVRGWIPGLTKKALARKPLVMVNIYTYLQSKARESVKFLAPPSPLHTHPQHPSTSYSNSSSLTSLAPAHRSSASASVYPASSSSTLSVPASSSRTSVIQPPPRRSSLNLLDNHNRLYPTPRHRSVRIDSMVTYKRWLNNDLTDWKHLASRDGFDFYSKACQGYELPVLRGQGLIHGHWTPEQVCSVVQNFGARAKWDDYFEDGQVVERFSQKEYLIYLKMKNVFPIQGRDFAVLSHIESDVKSGSIHVVSASVADDALVPVTTSHTRGRWLVYGWTFQAIKNEAGERTGVHVSFVSHMDLEGGAPLPSAIIRRLTNDIPAQVSRVGDYLRMYGCPPYVRRVAGKVLREQYDPENHTYSISLVCKHTPAASARRVAQNSENGENDAKHAKMVQQQQQQWCTDVRLDAAHYPQGFQAIAHPATHVQIVYKANNAGIRIYTKDPAADGTTIRVDITANALTPPLSPESATEATQLAPEQHEIAELAENASTSPPTKSILLPPRPFSQSSPNFIHPTSPVASTLSLETTNATKTANIKTLTARKAIVSIATTHGEAQAATISEVKAAKRRTPPRLPSTYVDPEPGPSFSMERRGSTSNNIIVIGDQLTFNGPQLSVMLVLMAICYYVGKLSCRCA